jgi:hypothetical protein
MHFMLQLFTFDFVPYLFSLCLFFCEQFINNSAQSQFYLCCSSEVLQPMTNAMKGI